MKKILYIDMDGVLVDFPSAFPHLSEKTLKAYENRLDEVPGIFSKMDPMKHAIESFHLLADKFDTYILSTAPWKNPSAWIDKLHWVQKYLGKAAHKRLILSHNKHLNVGDFLVDDRPNNGARDFTGEWIQFGSSGFEDWLKVRDHLQKQLA